MVRTPLMALKGHQSLTSSSVGTRHRAVDAAPHTANRRLNTAQKSNCGECNEGQQKRILDQILTVLFLPKCR